MQGRARAGWQDKETERLFQAVDQAAREGQPLRHVFESLSGELGRRVKIKVDAKGGGVLEISFYNKEDLSDLSMRFAEE